MSKRYILANWVVLTTVGLIAGCQHKDVNVLAREPNLQGTFIPSGYQSRAAEAAGGIDAWAKVTKLQLDSLVTFYQPDGSFYLTRQKYIIEVLKGGTRIPNAKSVIDNQCLAEAILSIVTAPVRFLDTSVDFTKNVNPIKIQGQWYYPLVRQTRADIESILRIPKAVFYQNRDNSIIEMVLIDCPGVNQFLTVRGYDYKEIKDGKIIVPQRIEIFLTDSQNSSQRRLVKIDIKQLR